MTDDLSVQLAHWRGWTGRTEQRTDLVTAALLAEAYVGIKQK
jgi:hypothetical protein